ncbi:hypothetical protein GOOTI_239_00270 [Gordonia otitidis NBRC 100426]|uniref:Uncharacterized protein n=3 Tax=Gordonia otitidis TaxID=249058 RepID=H5TTH2_GORO1|nr:hypothetical protein GOOTI_239_00270 [Gordonia otitidis NBRC 100426]
MLVGRGAARGRTMQMLIWILIAMCASGATVCAFGAAWVYLRGAPADRDRLARRWLAATAILAFSAIILRFVSVLR